MPAHPALPRLLQLVAQRLGIEQADGESDRSYARRLGAAAGVVPDRVLDPNRKLASDENRVRKVQTWREGLDNPGFIPTMQLLAAAGLLQPEAVAAWEDVSQGEAAKRVSAARLKATGAEARQAERDAGELPDRARPRRGRRRSA